MTLGCDSLTQPNVRDFKMETSAVLLEGAKQLSIQSVGLKEPTDGDVVVQVSHSGISTGTENLLWSGTMPPFPGMGYPQCLVMKPLVKLFMPKKVRRFHLVIMCLCLALMDLRML